MNNTLEKRRHSRYRCLVPIEGKEESGFDQTHTVDIGPQGMGLVSPRSISVHQKIPVEIVLTPQGDPIVVLGKVQWVRRLSGSRRYRVGISFTDFFTGSVFRLRKHLSLGDS